MRCSAFPFLVEVVKIAANGQVFIAVRLFIGISPVRMIALLQIAYFLYAAF